MRQPQRPIRVLASIIALLGLAVPLASCLDQGPGPSAAGAWVGRDGTRLVRLYITDNNGALEVVGHIEGPDGSIAATGTRVDRQFDLLVNVFYSGGISSALADGELVSRDYIVLQLVGAAFETNRLVLQRSSGLLTSPF